MSCVVLPKRNKICDSTGKFGPWWTCEKVNELGGDDIDCVSYDDEPHQTTRAGDKTRYQCCEWSPEGPSSSSSPPMSIGAIISFSVGGIFLLTAVIMGISFISEKKKSKKSG